MKNNSATGPDAIPIEFFRAIFCGTVRYGTKKKKKSATVMKNILILFNKILDRSFPKKLNTVSIVSIPKKKKKVIFLIVIIMKEFQ